MDAGAGKAAAGMTERQKKWFATVQANLEAQTGKSIAEWVEIMKTCPETTRGKQTAWLKAQHGIGVNHAAFILSQAETGTGPDWDDPDGLRAQLWKDPASEAILAAVEAVAAEVSDVVTGQRKAFTSFSRDVQFAAMRPLKSGGALIGFKLEPEQSARLSAPARRESWSERLVSTINLSAPADVDEEVRRLFALAAELG